MDENVRHHIPNDIAYSILSKLPLKSLKRFGGVHKLWVLLLKKPHFISLYRENFLSKNHSYYDGTSLLLHENAVKIALHMLSGERFQNHVKIDMPNPLQDDDPSFFILGVSSINGILCLYRYSMQNKFVVLWNPATKELKIIPSSLVGSEPYHVELHGFGYDHLKNDYKIIQCITFVSRTHYVLGGKEGQIAYDRLWEIYSLRSNSWSKLNVDIPRCAGDNGGARVYIDGVCHWWGSNEANNEEGYLVSFNMSNNVFITTLIPSDIDDCFGRELVQRHLVVLNGSISLISSYSETTIFHISILGEVGVKDSWTKLFTVGPLSGVEHPIGAGKKGKLFFRKENNELVWYDLTTQKIGEIGLKTRYDFGQIVVYKETTVGLEG